MIFNFIYPNLCFNISNIELIADNIVTINVITIYFTNYDKIMKFIAMGDCCSCSSNWFYFFDNGLIDRNFRND
jgi:hypothetical protein